MRGTLTAALVAMALMPGAALAGDLVELKDGRLVEVDRVRVVDDALVLHLTPSANVTLTTMRVDLDDIDPEAAVRLWGSALAESDAEGWLALARYSRENALFDLADKGYERAAGAGTAAQEDLEAFREARPREESRHHFERACEAFREGHRKGAADAARAAVAAHDSGPDAAMARELLHLLSETSDRPTPSQRRADDAAWRELKRLQTYADRGESRLQGTSRGSRARSVSSATRLLADVSERLRKLLESEIPGAVRTEATALLAEVDGHRVNGLLHLGDLALDAGNERLTLSAVHDVLAIRPDEPLALELRNRALDVGERDRERERRILSRGGRRIYHAYPYPARDVVSGIGLVPTWDPIRGLGKIPYSGRWWNDNTGYRVVERSRRLR